jgi:hypothetical protein
MIMGEGRWAGWTTKDGQGKKKRMMSLFALEFYANKERCLWRIHEAERNEFINGKINNNPISLKK